MPLINPNLVRVILPGERDMFSPQTEEGIRNIASDRMFCQMIANAHASAKQAWAENAERVAKGELMAGSCETGPTEAQQKIVDRLIQDGLIQNDKVEDDITLVEKPLPSTQPLPKSPSKWRRRLSLSSRSTPLTINVPKFPFSPPTLNIKSPKMLLRDLHLRRWNSAPPVMSTAEDFPVVEDPTPPLEDEPVTDEHEITEELDQWGRPLPPPGHLRDVTISVVRRTEEFLASRKALSAQDESAFVEPDVEDARPRRAPDGAIIFSNFHTNKFWSEMDKPFDFEFEHKIQSRHTILLLEPPPVEAPYVFDFDKHPLPKRMFPPVVDISPSPTQLRVMTKVVQLPVESLLNRTQFILDMTLSMFFATLVIFCTIVDIYTAAETIIERIFRCVRVPKMTLKLSLGPGVCEERVEDIRVFHDEFLSEMQVS